MINTSLSHQPYTLHHTVMMMMIHIILTHSVKAPSLCPSFFPYSLISYCPYDKANQFPSPTSNSKHPSSHQTLAKLESVPGISYPKFSPDTILSDNLTRPTVVHISQSIVIFHNHPIHHRPSLFLSQRRQTRKKHFPFLG